MKNYDAVVIGSGCGLSIVDECLAHGLKVALVDKGPLGGTCPNLGCILSKLLIYPADRIVDIQQSGKLGIEASVTEVDFKAIMGRMRKIIRENQTRMRRGITHSAKLDYYKGEGHFHPALPELVQLTLSSLES
ncbi:FAD-dependent oxidoreductase [Chloroflexota bacterium]